MMQSSGGSVDFQVMAMLSSVGRSELSGSARGNDRCSLYCDHGPAAGQCLQASVGFALNSVERCDYCLMDSRAFWRSASRSARSL